MSSECVFQPRSDDSSKEPRRKRKSPEFVAKLNALVAAARAGSRESLDLLLEQVLEDLRNERETKRRLNGGRTHGSSEFDAQAIYRAYAQFYRFTKSNTYAAFKSWVRKISLNEKLADQRSQDAHQKEDVLQKLWHLRNNTARPDDASLEDGLTLEQREELELALRTMASLSEREKIVIRMRLFHNREQSEKYSFAEIGELVGESANAVGKIYARAIRKLRDELCDTDE